LSSAPVGRKRFDEFAAVNALEVNGGDAGPAANRADDEIAPGGAHDGDISSTFGGSAVVDTLVARCVTSVGSSHRSSGREAPAGAQSGAGVGASTPSGGVASSRLTEHERARGGESESGS
jgi:hypothetical protein